MQADSSAAEPAGKPQFTGEEAGPELDNELRIARKCGVVKGPRYYGVSYSGEDPDAGKAGGQEEKGMTEDGDGWMALATQLT